MTIDKRLALASIGSLFLLSATALAVAPSVDLAQARASDPTLLGWMVGSPPPPDKLIRWEDGSFYRFPQWRWSFSHWRELRPTIAVARGPRPTRPLVRALREDLDAVTFMPLDGTAKMTWARSSFSACDVARYADEADDLPRGVGGWSTATIRRQISPVR